ncbi:hypothetical protein [Mesorhizobium sp. L-2-11]|uniref:hypothetical protein n=1 Tax=Mesorhizobium sp. L-2-11 TaxID=2744521 RepID=UPI001928EE46|nr:hypothetical protein [Mesorhizobium sp. L-2-11]BCH15070.1 hypothetical protein MesoLjLa_19210 [Mesorhizobium sp. L-2-11]
MNRVRNLGLAVAVLSLWLTATYVPQARSAPQCPAAPRWDEVQAFRLEGGLKAYWNVYDGSGGSHVAAALCHGFLPVTIQNTFADYPGAQRENINTFLGKLNTNPWRKPDFFERIVRRNIDLALPVAGGIYVHDIEFVFQRSALKAWVLNAIGRRFFSSFTEFEDSYWKEWATWFVLPVKWTRERYTDAVVGIFGPQPFFKETGKIRDYSAQDFAEKHSFDLKLWKSIDPYVDFIITEAYLPDSKPDSVFYIATQIEQNYYRSEKISGKPIFAYLWLRYYGPDWRQATPLVDTFLVEAMTLVPYFSGARAVVLWGHEPSVKSGDPLPYSQLPLFTHTLARLSTVSDLIGRGRLVPGEPANVLWRERRPLVRMFDVGKEGCVALVINPWQAEDAVSSAKVECQGRAYPVAVKGRHATLAQISSGAIILH